MAAPVVVGIIDEGGSAGATQVFVGEVENDLVIGIAVNRSHGASDNLEIVVYDLGHGCEAVRGAGCIGDDVMLRGIVVAFVDA